MTHIPRHFRPTFDHISDIQFPTFINILITFDNIPAPPLTINPTLDSATCDQDISSSDHQQSRSNHRRENFKVAGGGGGGESSDSSSSSTNISSFPTSNPTLIPTLSPTHFEAAQKFIRQQQSQQPPSIEENSIQAQDLDNGLFVAGHVLPASARCPADRLPSQRVRHDQVHFRFGVPDAISVRPSELRTRSRCSGFPLRIWSRLTSGQSF